MNQEKIMKRKMICAIVMFIAALIGLFVMAGCTLTNRRKCRKRTGRSSRKT